MKTSFILLVSLILFTACQDECPERYSQDAPEIELYKQSIADYASQNWESMRSKYADDAKIHHNTDNDTPNTVEEAIEAHQNTIAQLSEFGFDDGDSEFERVLTDDDEMWVNYWGNWYGVVAATGKRVEIPIHLTARIVDSLIVAEYGYWNSLPLFMALNEASEIARAAEETENATEDVEEMKE